MIITMSIASCQLAWGLDWSMWVAVLLAPASILATMMIPLVNIFHPITQGLYILAALLCSREDITICFYITLVLFVLHVARCWYMIAFNKKHPIIAKYYDQAIRENTDIDVLSLKALFVMDDQ